MHHPRARIIMFACRRLKIKQIPIRKKLDLLNELLQQYPSFREEHPAAEALLQSAFQELIQQEVSSGQGLHDGILELMQVVPLYSVEPYELCLDWACAGGTYDSICRICINAMIMQ